MEIEGKVVAITGASAGIGAATAELLADHRARVVLGARREPELVAVRDRIAEAGGEAISRVTDVTRADDLVALVEHAVQRFGRLDALVANAGIAVGSSLARAACESLRQEVGPEIRCTMVSPGFTNTDFIESTRDPDALAAARVRRDAIAMPPTAVAESIAFAIGQPADVNVGELVVRSAAQA